MDKLTMAAPDIAELVINSREKGYAVIIPADSMYQLSVALKAAEAQLAELASQPSNTGDIVAIFTHAAPPAPFDLAALVPDEAEACEEFGDAEAQGFNSCRAEMLRRIEQVQRAAE